MDTYPRLQIFKPFRR